MAAIRHKRRNRGWLIAGMGTWLAGLWLAGLSQPSAATAQQAGAKPPPASVTVAAVEEREIGGEQSFVATVMPARKSIVGSAVDGRVLEFLVKEGDFVHEGDPIAKLRTKAIEIEIEGARAELQLREQELAELENGARPEEIAQAEARMRGAEALQEYTASKRKRVEELFNRQISSQDDLADVVSLDRRAEESYIEAKVAYELLVAGPRDEEIAQAAAKVASQTEVINGLLDRLEKFTIVAPFDGYVVTEYTEVGHWIKQGDQVAELLDLAHVDVVVQVPENFAAHLRLGMSGRVEVGALPERLFAGPVVAIVPNADLRARSFPVKVRLENEVQGSIPLLKAGMFARVSLPVGSSAAGLMVPKDAVVLGGPRPLVYVVDRGGDAAQGVARAVPVDLGAADGDAIQVRGELRAGDLVVVTGNERLRPGQDVAILPAADAAAARGPAATE